jgi:hypothetical protein
MAYKRNYSNRIIFDEKLVEGIDLLWVWADDGERRRRYLSALLRGVKCEAGAEWLQPSTPQWGWGRGLERE